MMTIADYSRLVSDIKRASEHRYVSTIDLERKTMLTQEERNGLQRLNRESWEQGVIDAEVEQEIEHKLKLWNLMPLADKLAILQMANEEVKLIQ